MSKISSVNILAKKIDCVDVYQPAIGLPDPKIKKLERYLDAVRSNLLFAKGVVLVEGDAEEILIPALIKTVYGISLDELGVSLINIRSTGFENVAVVFDEMRIRRNCAIVTDLDTAIGDDKGAETKGAKRKKTLDALCKDNNFIKAFYAKYTFEIDFLMDGNHSEVSKLITEVYTDKHTIEKSYTDLKSSKVSVAGKRVLTMAKNAGKGWFAIDLAAAITPTTNIPQYIIDAILFAKGGVSEATYKQMLEYRFSLIDSTTVEKEVYLELKGMFEDDKSTIDDLISHSLLKSDLQVSRFKK